MTTSEQEFSRAALEQRTSAIGLVHHTADQLDEFAHAEAYALELAERLPRNFTLAEEPALVFRAGSES
jgi:hypothetical protein